MTLSFSTNDNKNLIIIWTILILASYIACKERIMKRSIQAIWSWIIGIDKTFMISFQLITQALVISFRMKIKRKSREIAKTSCQTCLLLEVLRSIPAPRLRRQKETTKTFLTWKTPARTLFWTTAWTDLSKVVHTRKATKWTNLVFHKIQFKTEKNWTKGIKWMKMIKIMTKLYRKKTKSPATPVRRNYPDILSTSHPQLLVNKMISISSKMMIMKWSMKYWAQIMTRPKQIY